MSIDEFRRCTNIYGQSLPWIDYVSVIPNFVTYDEWADFIISVISPNENAEFDAIWDKFKKSNPAEGFILDNLLCGKLTDFITLNYWYRGIKE